MSADAPHAPCRNCGTVLQGPFCHVCGQHGHDPLRSFAHAVEDVFESFWHLDGRVFRTLRDLLVPGRLAMAYLDGRRARYLPPLRLFVILTVLTFFVGKLTLHVTPPDATETRGVRTEMEAGIDDIAAAATPEAVLRERELALAKLHTLNTSGDLAADPVASWFLPALEALVRPQIDTAARERMRTLGAGTADLAQLEARIRADTAEAERRTAAKSASQDPAYAWIARRGLRLRENVAQLQHDPDSFIRLFLGAVPGALFVLVPLFALCLKLLYLRGGRGYLQHLVVALYSHSAMLLALLAVFVIAGLQAKAGAGMAAVLAAAGGLLLTVAVPGYLLVMQKRVYGQNWAWTLVKYLALATVYMLLLGIAAVYAMLAGLSA